MTIIALSLRREREASASERVRVGNVAGRSRKSKALTPTLSRRKGRGSYSPGAR
jgi:hypothetical protein